jgi:hypothetical protein
MVNCLTLEVDVLRIIWPKVNDSVSCDMCLLFLVHPIENGFLPMTEYCSTHFCLIIEQQMVVP